MLDENVTNTGPVSTKGRAISHSLLIIEPSGFIIPILICVLILCFTLFYGKAELSFRDLLRVAPTKVFFWWLSRSDAKFRGGTGLP